MLYIHVIDHGPWLPVPHRSFGASLMLFRSGLGPNSGRKEGGGGWLEMVGAARMEPERWKCLKLAFWSNSCPFCFRFDKSISDTWEEVLQLQLGR